MRTKGLALLAALFCVAATAAGAADPGTADRILRRAATVEGRGACRHPDGVARFVRTAVGVFGDHAGLHLSRGPCQTTRPFLSVPVTPVAGAR